MIKVRTCPLSSSSVFKSRTTSQKRSYIVLLTFALALNICVRGVRGQGAVLPARGVEEAGRVHIGEPVSAYVGHMAMLFVTGKHPTVSNGTMQDTVNWVNDPLHSYVADGTGGLAVYAHPDIANRVLLLNGLTGMEVFHKTTLPSASPFRDQCWDAVLTSLYAQGKPLIWGFAGDDTHSTSPGLYNFSYNVSLVPSVDLFALKNALRNGAFYTTNGPAINGVSVTGTTITLNLGQSSKVLWLRAGQYDTGGSFTQSATTLGASKAVKIEQGVTTSSLDIATLGIPLADLRFVRAIVSTSSNATSGSSYALTQPFKISSSGDISNPYPTTGTWIKGQSHNHDDAWIDNNTEGITTHRSNYQSVGQLASFETAYSYWEAPYQRLDSDGFPDVASVSPEKVSWGLSPEITINGVNFAEGAAVQLGAYPLINVVRQSATVLRATVPVEIPPGVYDLVVTNPDNYRGTLAMALTIQGSTADNTHWTSYKTPDLPWNQTTSVQAINDEVWVGTMKGAARFKDGVWSQFVPSGGLNIFSRGIYSIAADPAGGIWFSSEGMWFRNSDGAFPWQWQSVKSSTSERWGKMAFDTGGTLWVTSRWAEGIAKRSPSGSWTVTTAGLPSTDNQAITRDSLGNMWVGFSGGQGIWKWNGSAWLNVPVPGGTAGLAQATYASALVTAPNGDVWAAVHPMNLAYAPEKSGVVRYIGGNSSTTQVFKAPQLPHPRVTDILVTTSGDVWFASRVGVSRLTAGGEWQKFTTQNSGLISDIVMDMAEDAAGNIWFATANGVSTFSTFDFTLLDSGDISVAQGSAGTTNIDVTLVSDPTRAVTFSVSGLPAGANASYSQSSCSPDCTTVLTITTSPSTAPGTYPITLSGTSGNLVRSTDLNLIVNSGSATPLASDDNYNTNEDTTLTVAAPGVLGNDTDADGNSLTAILVNGPAHGTLTLNANGSLSYTPAANYNGPDSFTYKANDGTADSNVATVAITVTAVDDAPLAVNDSYNTNEDTALTVTAPGVLGNDTDADGNTLTAILVNGPAHGTLTLNANGSLSYTPAANYNGPDSFTYKANDGTADSNVATVAITVTAVNDAPLAVNDSYNTNEDTALTVAAPGVLGNDTDADGNSLTAILVNGPAHGTLTLNANGSLSYTPAANYNGPDSFTYKANDGTADSNVATVAITVTAVDDAPLAVNDSYNTNEDTALTVTAPGVLGNDTDADGNSLTAILVNGPAHGTLTLNANGSLSYTPAAGYNGPDSFTYKANDGTADSNVATVAITVTAVNDAPLAVNDSYNTNEDTALTVAAPGVLGNDTDADGNSLTAILVNGPAHGTLTLNANGSLSYTPAANYNGPDSFTYKANDGTADSNVATVAITVTAVDDAPLAVNDSYNTNEDTALTVTAPGVLGNDTDADGNTLTAILVNGPAHGTLTLNANGSLSYTPAAGYNGPDSFTYKANDGTADSNVADRGDHRRSS